MSQIPHQQGVTQIYRLLAIILFYDDTSQIIAPCGSKRPQPQNLEQGKSNKRKRRASEDCDPSASRIEEPDDINLDKVEVWIVDSTNTCTAKLFLGTHSTIPDLFEAIKEAFLNLNTDKADFISSKGDVVAISIRLLGQEPTEFVKDVSSPFTLDVMMPLEGLKGLRLHLDLQLKEYRKDGRGILCISTALFENDLREEMAAKGD
jgi:hypothetical protein